MCNSPRTTGNGVAGYILARVMEGEGQPAGKELVVAGAMSRSCQPAPAGTLRQIKPDQRSEAMGLRYARTPP